MSAKYRNYIYGIAVAFGPLFILYGWLTAEEWEIIENIIVAILVTGSGTLARRHLTPDESHE